MVVRWLTCTPACFSPVVYRENGRRGAGHSQHRTTRSAAAARRLYGSRLTRRLVFSIVFYNENNRPRTAAAGTGRAMRRGFAPWADRTVRPLVRFEGVTKRFGGVTAVDRLSLDIYEGEFFALLGPS